jgi:hypothetical protein
MTQLPCLAQLRQYESTRAVALTPTLTGACRRLYGREGAGGVIHACKGCGAAPQPALK